jgi:ribosomal protein L37AE/L43A
MDFHLNGSLSRIEFHEPKQEAQKDQGCQHSNRADVSVMGSPRWMCKDCGFVKEEITRH